MERNIYSVITATGRYLPSVVLANEEFLKNEFYDLNGKRIEASASEIIDKFREITEIDERQYAEDEHVASDLGYFAAEEALKSSGIDRETLDYIIVAHNFGDVRKSNPQTDMVPTIAARVKRKLGIINPYTVAFDLPFGCPGWLQALIHADYFIRSGDAKKILVIGTETLSRVSDPHDRDSMIYSDGAGAVIVEAVKSEQPIGILTHISRSDTIQHAHLLSMGPSNKPDFSKDRLFLKMEGRKLYEYALNTVPQLVRDSLEKARVAITSVKKVLIHQANMKMDDAILKRLFRLYGMSEIPEHIMPMTIAKFGNNSVATLPILLDMILKGKMNDQHLFSEDYLIFASVGAGMNCNAMVYKVA